MHYQGRSYIPMQEETATAVSARRAKRVSFDVAATWAVIATFALSAIAFIPSATIPFISTKVTLIALGTLVTLVLFILARLTRGNIIVPPYGTNQRKYLGVLGTHRLKLGDGYALHGTDQPQSIGKSVSHGCIRLRNEDIETLFQMVPVGTVVYVY